MLASPPEATAVATPKTTNTNAESNDTHLRDGATGNTLRARAKDKKRIWNPISPR
jgi:hypothetical protein